MAQGPVAQGPVAQGPLAQGLCGSRALWLKDFVAQRPVAQGQRLKGLWLSGFVAEVDSQLPCTWWCWVHMERNWLIHDGTWS